MFTFIIMQRVKKSNKYRHQRARHSIVNKIIPNVDLKTQVHMTHYFTRAYKYNHILSYQAHVNNNINCIDMRNIVIIIYIDIA